MSWTPPRAEEIAMSAEIGAYQDDLDREPPRDPGGPTRIGATAVHVASATHVDAAVHIASVTPQDEIAEHSEAK